MSDDIPNELILDKIRKIQGYLKSDNPNEAAVAAAKLTEMLVRYNLELSDIPAASRPVDPFVNTTTDDETKRLSDWRVKLGNAIANANLCKVVISGSHLQWLGRQSNVEVAQYIYETCAADLNRIADTFWYAIKGILKDTDVELMHGKTWKAQFLMGAAKGVADKLQDESAKWRSEPNIMALVVTNDRELQSYVRSQYPHLGTRSASYAAGGNAYGLGVQTGRNISFKTGVGAGGSNSTRQLKGNW